MSSSLSSSRSMTSEENRRVAISPRRPASLQEDAPPPDTEEVPKSPGRLKSVLKALFVVYLVRFLLLELFISWTKPAPGYRPSELHCVVDKVHKGLLYCNHDCMPRFREKNKLEIFTMKHPEIPTYFVNKPFIFGQPTLYCLAHDELELVWLPWKVEKSTKGIATLKRGRRRVDGNGTIPWPMLYADGIIRVPVLA